MVYIVAPVIKRQLRIAAEANAAASSLMVESLPVFKRLKLSTLKPHFVGVGSSVMPVSFHLISARHSLVPPPDLLVVSSMKLVVSQFSGWVPIWFLKVSLTIGQLIAFRIISGNVVGPIIRLAGTWQTIQSLQISIERLADVVDAPTEQPEDIQPIALPPIKGKVEFENVSFSFNPHAAPVVKSVSFCIDQANSSELLVKVVAVKSTIMKLLPRLYNLEEWCDSY